MLVLLIVTKVSCLADLYMCGGQVKIKSMSEQQHGPLYFTNIAF